MLGRNYPLGQTIGATVSQIVTHPRDPLTCRNREKKSPALGEAGP